MAYLIEALQDNLPVQGLPLARGSITIGSDRKNNIILKHSEVEPVHAKIVYDGELLAIYRVATNAVIRVNGRKVRSTFLRFSDVITVGPFSIKFAEEGAREEIDVQVLCARLHQELVARLDLGNLRIEELTDKDLWTKCETVVDQIFATSYIPPSIDRTKLKTKILQEALGLGPLEQLLADDTVTEIMVNSKDDIFIERKGKIYRDKELSFTSNQQVVNIISRIVNPLGRRIDESMPLVDARLKDGSRVNAIIPPLAISGPSITIRKFSKRRLVVEDLIQYGSLTKDMATFLEFCVRGKLSMIISGGTGSGKTTLLNVLSNFIPNDERVVSIEDSAELKLYQPNLVSLEARTANIEGKGQIAIRDLVKNALRMRPDRIIVGECRAGETLDMLQAMNTGHDGSLTTLHANAPEDAVLRVETMVMMSGFELPIRVIRSQIVSAVRVLVQQTRLSDGSRKIVAVSEIIELDEGDNVILKDIFKFNRVGFDKNNNVLGYHSGTGHIPKFVEEFERMGIAIDKKIFNPLPNPYA